MLSLVSIAGCTPPSAPQHEQSGLDSIAQDKHDHSLAAGSGQPLAQSPYRQGLSHLSAGRCRKALVPLSSAYLANQGNAAAAEALVRAQSVCGDDMSSALALATELFQALPEPQFAETLAMALAASGDFDRAVALQRRVVRNEPGRDFGQHLLLRFESCLPADSAWPPNDPVYRVPRLVSDQAWANPGSRQK